jgi:hypothetical protein
MGTADNWPLPALHHLSDDTVLSTNMNYYSIYQQLEFKLAAAHSADSAARTDALRSFPKPAGRQSGLAFDLCGPFCVKSDGGGGERLLLKQGISPSITTCCQVA